MIGDPEYIHLLINPDEKTVAVTGAGKHEYLAHHINAYEGMKRPECLIISKDLLQEIRSITGKTDDRTDALCGRYIADMNAVVFCLDRKDEETEKNQ